MKKFLEDLFARIEKVNLRGLRPALEEIESVKGVRIIGILPDNLKKFWAVVNAEGDALDKECESAHRRMEKMFEPMAKRSPGDLKFAQEHILRHGRHEVAVSLLWQEIKETFPESFLSRGSIGVRTGWKVVIVPPQGPSLPGVEVIGIIELPSFPSKPRPLHDPQEN